MNFSGLRVLLISPLFFLWLY